MNTLLSIITCLLAGTSIWQAFTIRELKRTRAAEASLAEAQAERAYIENYKLVIDGLRSEIERLQQRVDTLQSEVERLRDK